MVDIEEIEGLPHGFFPVGPAIRSATVLVNELFEKSLVSGQLGWQNRRFPGGSIDLMGVPLDCGISHRTGIDIVGKWVVGSETYRMGLGPVVGDKLWFQIEARSPPSARLIGLGLDGEKLSALGPCGSSIGV